MIRINNALLPMPRGAVAYKHADPMQGARWLYDGEEAQEIAEVDTSLIVWPVAVLEAQALVDELLERESSLQAEACRVSENGTPQDERFTAARLSDLRADLEATQAVAPAAEPGRAMS